MPENKAIYYIVGMQNNAYTLVKKQNIAYTSSKLRQDQLKGKQSKHQLEGKRSKHQQTSVEANALYK